MAITRTGTSSLCAIILQGVLLTFFCVVAGKKTAVSFNLWLC